MVISEQRLRKLRHVHGLLVQDVLSKLKFGSRDAHGLVLKSQDRMLADERVDALTTSVADSVVVRQQQRSMLSLKTVPTSILKYISYRIGMFLYLATMEFVSRRYHFGGWSWSWSI